MNRIGYCFLVLNIILLSSCSSISDDHDRVYNAVEVYNDFWRSYDLYYANFFVKSLDWDAVYEKYRSRIDKQTNDEILYQILTEIEQKELKDGHSYIAQTKEYLISYQPKRVGFDDSYLVSERYYTNEVDILDSKMEFIEYGFVKPELTVGSGLIGYLRVKAFMPDNELQSFGQFKSEVDKAMNLLRSTSSIIIDVRNNRGGYSPWSEYLAGYFTLTSGEYMIEKVRYNDNRMDLKVIKNSFVVSTSSNFVYDGNCTVLMNRLTASAAEIFVVAMKRLSQVTTIGTRTFGIFSPSMYRELVNGWYVRIPVSDVRLPNGISYEGVGISPDIKMKNVSLSSFEDPALIKAINHANKN
ncbi:S41 family peptidase [Halosquirtibacter xylanolyticus]|uniref:S41 family peptidase n=1 Tax=Halosquirtibacter xylanolyticus TaxID=3374599 RepID=UPI003749B927|nr:S41 family peptidase [Prolixibacteraceae bacterium]